MLLTVGGDQVPVIGTALFEDVGNTGAGEPGQIGAGAKKAGTILGVTTISIVVGNEH